MHVVVHLSATLAKSGPLDFPSEKRFLLFFGHEKGLGFRTHVSKMIRVDPSKSKVIRVDPSL